MEIGQQIGISMDGCLDQVQSAVEREVIINKKIVFYELFVSKYSRSEVC